MFGFECGARTGTAKAEQTYKTHEGNQRHTDKRGRTRFHRNRACFPRAGLTRPHWCAFPHGSLDERRRKLKPLRGVALPLACWSEAFAVFGEHDRAKISRNSP